MKPLELPLLADENIHPGVVAGLRKRGNDVRTVDDVVERKGDQVRVRVRSGT